MASDRETRIPENLPDLSLVDGEPHIADEDALLEALFGIVHALRYFGGTVQIGALRQPIAPEVAPDAFVTTEYVVRWNPFQLKKPVVEMDSADNGATAEVGG
jgi:hypothetical protein